MRPPPFLLLRRTYATVRSTSSSSSSSSSSSCPHRWPQSAHPTPYEILETPRGTKYNPHRFLELAKLYHPDHAAHHAHHSNACSPELRRERFRLVMDANRFLVEEQQQQRRGGGRGQGVRAGGERRWWGGAREGHAVDPAAYGGGGRDDCSHNATWEDWERWREGRRQGGGQEEVFMRNGAFVGCVMVVACVGCWIELGYVAARGDGNVEALERQSGELGRDLRIRRMMAVDRAEDSDERVRRFLLMRDPERLVREKEVARLEREGREGREGRRGLGPPPPPPPPRLEPPPQRLEE